MQLDPLAQNTGTQEDCSEGRRGLLSFGPVMLHPQGVKSIGRAYLQPKKIIKAFLHTSLTGPSHPHGLVQIPPPPSFDRMEGRHSSLYPLTQATPNPTGGLPRAQSLLRANSCPLRDLRCRVEDRPVFRKSSPLSKVSRWP